MPQPADLLSTREAADLLGVSEFTLRRWADRGVIPQRLWPPTGEKRRRKFTRADVEALRAKLAEPVEVAG